jgi:Trk K+ transport system NAD-binding subunit
VQTRLNIDRLTTRVQPHAPLRWRLWREWCFARTVISTLKYRILILVLVLAAGSALFRHLQPELGLSPLQATYSAWSLLFGEPPQEFPQSPVLAAMFFILPVLGLTVVLEGMIELALMLRDRRRNERDWCRAMCKAMEDHVVLIGLGRLGYRTFLLLRKLGVQVVVIERDEKNQFLEDVRRDGSPLLIGDARRESILQEANIAHARSLVLATTNDLANLEIALDARKFAPKVRVVLRMFDQNMADKVAEGFDIRPAMSQSAISAPAFATAAIEPDIINSVVVDDRLIVMKRWTVRSSSPVSGLTVGTLLDRFEVAVIEHEREGSGHKLFPPTSTRLEAGDAIVIQGPFDELARLSMTNRG